MPEEQTNTSLNRLRVLHLEDTPRAKILKQRWLYYTCQHNDGMGVDYDGYQHTPGLSYLGERMRGLGFVPAQNSSIPFGQKRPICHSLSVGHIVDTYTALLLGEGRQPAVRVVGDPQSTDLIGALLKYCGAWAAFAEARKVSGATGGAAILPEICKGKMSLRSLRPENLYVQWSDEADWIPTMVIEQKRVRVERLDEDTGKVATVEVWRTRAWDEVHSYAFHDKVIESDDGADKSEGSTPDQRIELSEAPTRHGAGRCPVVWIQNTTDSDDPVGASDCEAVYEHIDQLDRSQSMLVRGARANTDPTLMVRDKPMFLRKWPNRRKGYGAKIEVSEVGDAKLLEITGDSIKTANETASRLERAIERRTGVIQPDPENSGAYQSGVALQLLWNTQHSRAAERRTPLGVGIRQTIQVMLAQLRTFGLRAIGALSEGVEVPPREVLVDADDSDDEGETKLEEHTTGPGGAIVLDWPGFHQATPQDLATTADALSKATNGQPFMSQETAVAHMTKLAQTDTDVGEELDRISGEREAKEAEFFDAMRPDVPDEELDGSVVDATAVEGTDQVQHEAMNGIQVKTFGDVLARVGKDLTPEAARLTINEGFPNTREPARAAELERAINAQLEEAAQDEKKGETIAGGQRFDSLGRPLTRGSKKSAERDEPAEQAQGEAEQNLVDEQPDP